MFGVMVLRTSKPASGCTNPSKFRFYFSLIFDDSAYVILLDYRNRGHICNPSQNLKSLRLCLSMCRVAHLSALCEGFVSGSTSETFYNTIPIPDLNQCMMNSLPDVASDSITWQLMCFILFFVWEEGGAP